MEIKKPIKKPCGNPDCSVSTHIGDCLSFGSGKLDECGFWEFPCRICAKAAENRDRANGDLDYMPYWPEDLNACYEEVSRPCG